MGFDEAVNPDIEIGGDYQPALDGLGPFGIVPIILPHKNKARFVMLTDESCRKDSYSYLPSHALADGSETPIAINPNMQHRQYLMTAHGYQPLKLDQYQQQTVAIPPLSDDCLPMSQQQRQLQLVSELMPPPQDPCLELANPLVDDDDDFNQYSPASPYQLVSHSENLPIYQVIETNDTSVIGGLLAFGGIGGVAAGIGLLANYQNNVTSHRKVIGKEMAYMVPELNPPKSYQEIANWLDIDTHISWQQLRGFKVIAGVYAIAHAGGDFSAEGIWNHTVSKERKRDNANSPESEIITVTLAFEKQHRFKLTTGVVPIISASKDLLHAATSKTLTFKFKNIGQHQPLQQLLEKLLNKQNTLDDNNRAIIEAMDLAKQYKEQGDEQAPLSFICQSNRQQTEDNEKLRFKIPLIASKQTLTKKRARIEQRSVNVGQQTVQNQVEISEKIKRKEFQYPIETALTARENRIYAQRLGIDNNNNIKWPIDYRNNLYEEITQVRDSSQVDMTSPFQTSHYRLMWKAADNYTTKDRFNHILNKIGSKTGLLPILFKDEDIEDFLGPVQQQDNPRESMYLLIEMHLSDQDWDQLCQNILSNNADCFFEELTLKLFDNYAKHPNKDYLNLNKDYSSFEKYCQKERLEIKAQAVEVIEKAQKMHKMLVEDKKESFFGLFSHKLTNQEKLNCKRKILDAIKVNPFVFLTALNHINPKCHIKISGTSSSLERILETSLARDIMNNKATIPESYQPPPYADLMPEI